MKTDKNICGSLVKNQTHAVAFVPDYSPCVKSNAGKNSDAAMEAQSLIVQDIAPNLTSNGDAHSGFRDEHGLVAHTLKGEGFDASEDGTGRGTPLVAIGWNGDTTPKTGIEVSPTLRREQGGEGIGIGIGMAVRRLTPRECERLQGFPDDWTNIPWRSGKAVTEFPRGPLQAECPDGPRYKALGNSMAVPVMRWIGERLAAVDAITEGNP